MLKHEWNEHTITVTGNWSLRWLYLSVDYELWLDDERLDRSGGPRLHPKLHAFVVDNEGQEQEIRVSILSIVGLNPEGKFYFNDELVSEGRVRVENKANPVMMMLILISIGVMLYFGPRVWTQYFG